ncbi:TPA: hypothetical protein QB286_002139 [Pasteurella multocida]|nr:hypothetical protein [Pasteurella multocida]HDR1191739.1 hypothetical protein [Pasteurella multocida]HDR1201984.1 hypothetical protein [Pasteurella multocida]HDR1212783.1 hypothetical protein [Pasteurella multocida]
MGLVFILFILVVGYYYATNYLPAKVVLKRSNGWEAYVNLGKHGLNFLLRGAFATFFIAVALYLLSLALNIFKYIGFWEYEPWKLHEYLNYEVFSIDTFSIKVYMLFLLVFSIAICKEEIKKRQREGKDFEELKETSSMLNLILEAAETQTPLKVSLKSKKVYVGIVDSEQFEHADLDNITIIPYLSGYRHKDNLNIIFDCNYATVYEKHKIGITAEGPHTLRHFRILIRVAEIESISLFNLEYYEDFENLEPTTESEKSG